MTKSLVVFCTASFPYYPGEQFVESEVDHWSGLPWARVVICPFKPAGEARFVPGDVEVSQEKTATSLHKAWHAVRAACSRLFWRELGYLVSEKRLGAATCMAALKTTATVLMAETKYRRLVKGYGHVSLAYCYWNSAFAYAACLLKREGLIASVVSRAHGFDLYEHRRPNMYMPLKRQFVRDFDAVFSVSQAGKEHLRSTYGFPESALSVSRLGVRVPEQAAFPNEDGVIRIVSVSFCVPVKRIDRIIEMIRMAASSNNISSINWTHIGDGPLRMRLEELAEEHLESLSNVTVRFAGAMSNRDVLAFYAQNPVDLFINCSESEGVPVSIMEAMACGVPVIAPAVGGIPELVCDECGALLPEDSPTETAVASIERLVGDGRGRYRAAARRRIIASYCSDTNFDEFVATLRSFAGAG